MVSIAALGGCGYWWQCSQDHQVESTSHFLKIDAAMENVFSDQGHNTLEDGEYASSEIAKADSEQDTSEVDSYEMESAHHLPMVNAADDLFSETDLLVDDKQSDDDGNYALPETSNLATNQDIPEVANDAMNEQVEAIVGAEHTDDVVVKDKVSNIAPESEPLDVEQAKLGEVDSTMIEVVASLEVISHADNMTQEEDCVEDETVVIAPPDVQQDNAETHGSIIEHSEDMLEKTHYANETKFEEVLQKASPEIEILDTQQDKSEAEISATLAYNYE
jgi:hypothetical protein